jgi:hypothetical protein
MRWQYGNSQDSMIKNKVCHLYDKFLHRKRNLLKNRIWSVYTQGLNI